MKVFFDFYEIGLVHGKSIGIYNYAIALLRAMSVKDISFTVGISGEEKGAIAEIPGINIVEVSKNYPGFATRIKWRLWGAIKMAKKYNCDIYYSPKGFAPGFYKRNKRPFTVLTIHDMIPFYYKENYPEHFGKKENFIVTNYLKKSAQIANLVITISEYSKKMIAFYTGSKTNIRVIYNGVDVKLGSKKLDNSKYIFAITSNLPHKNMENVILGYVEYWKKNIDPLPLIICGIDNNQEVIPNECRNSIKCIPYAESAEFATLFSNATLFMFLPRIEGFGFPPIEAMMYNVPAIVSKIPVLEEVLGDSVYYVNAEIPQEIGAAIATLISGPDIITTLKGSAQQKINKYTWLNCADHTYKAFEEVLK